MAPPQVPEARRSSPTPDLLVPFVTSHLAAIDARFLIALPFQWGARFCGPGTIPGKGVMGENNFSSVERAGALEGFSAGDRLQAVGSALERCPAA